MDPEDVLLSLSLIANVIFGVATLMRSRSSGVWEKKARIYELLTSGVSQLRAAVYNMEDLECLAKRHNGGVLDESMTFREQKKQAQAIIKGVESVLVDIRRAKEKELEGLMIQVNRLSFEIQLLVKRTSPSK